MVRVPNRDQVKAKLGEMGIPTDIYYPKGIPDEDIMKKYKKPGDVFPVADECSKSILALPIFPELTKAELEKVVDGFHKVV
jgi:UDP-2-acetamido-2-deoxy-ribo-hexuluronate aminotransferase